MTLSFSQGDQLDKTPRVSFPTVSSKKSVGQMFLVKRRLAMSYLCNEHVNVSQVLLNVVLQQKQQKMKQIVF